MRTWTPGTPTSAPPIRTARRSAGPPRKVFWTERAAGTPEAGGLTSRELLATLRSFARLNLVGADIVEVAPAYDHAQITGIAAAHVGYEILSAFAVRS